MKNLTSFWFLIFTTLFLSCQNDNNSNTPIPTINPIAGQWNLVNVNGSIAGINDSFTSGMITWNFNTINQTVAIVNTNTDQNLQDFLETGTYPYAIEINEATPELCALNIKINNTNMGCFSIQNNELLMSQVETDGYNVKLIR